jgi:hypothetical protein
MSRRTVVLATDNVSGEDIEGDVNVVKLDLGEGQSYQLDLGDKTFLDLKRTLQPYIDVADVMKGRTVSNGSPGAGGTSADPEIQKIREWGRTNGYDVPTHGRLPTDLREAYEAAN